MYWTEDVEEGETHIFYLIHSSGLTESDMIKQRLLYYVCIS